MEDDLRAPRRLIALGHFVAAVLVAYPIDSRRTGVRARFHFHAVTDHKDRVEAETEVADDALLRRVALALVLTDEIQCARQRDLVDVALHLLARHPDAVIRDSDGLSVPIQCDVDAEIVVPDLRLSKRNEPPELGNRVSRIGHSFANKDVLIRIQPALDDGKNIFGLYGKRTFFHLTKPLSAYYLE